MKNFTTKTVIFLLVLCAFQLSAQEHSGISSSDYANLMGSQYNPAVLADMPHKAEVMIAGGSVSYNAKFAKVKNYFGAIGGLASRLPGDLGNFGKDNIVFDKSDKTFRLLQENRMPTLSFAINLDNNAGTIAINTENRSVISADNINPFLAESFFTGRTNPTLIGQSISNQNVLVQSTSWMEVGASYGRKIWSNDRHYLKGALNLKLLLPGSSLMMRSDDLIVNFTDQDSLNFSSTGPLDYWHSESFQNWHNILKDISSPSLGGGLGFIYEFRPEFEDYSFVRSRDDKRIYQPGIPLHRLRVGLALTDFGNLKYKRDVKAQTFNPNGTPFSIIGTDFESIAKIDSSLALSGMANGNADGYTYKMPTRLNLQIDARIIGELFVNVSGSMMLNKFEKFKVAGQSFVTITPKYDTPWFGFYLPVSMNGYEPAKVGLSFRLGPVYIGTSNVPGLFGATKSTDFFAGLCMPITGKSKKEYFSEQENDLAFRGSEERAALAEIEKEISAKKAELAEKETDLARKAQAAAEARALEADKQRMAAEATAASAKAEAAEAKAREKVALNNTQAARDSLAVAKTRAELLASQADSANKQAAEAKAAAKTATEAATKAEQDKTVAINSAKDAESRKKEVEAALAAKVATKPSTTTPVKPTTTTPVNVNLQNLYFESNTKDINNNNQFVVMQAVYDIMKNNPAYKLRIIGFSDNSEDLNLANTRATEAKKFLINKGLTGGRIFVESKSKSNLSKVEENRKVKFEIFQ